MITGRQIRAARGLLNWDATVLAEKAGLTRETVSRIETDSVQAQERSLIKIQQACEEAGVEFIENQGVRFKSRGIEVYEGNLQFRKFMDDIYETAKAGNTDICILGVSETDFHKHLSEEFGYAHIKRMTELKSLKVRCLVCEGDSEVYCESYNEYRWVPKQSFSAVPFYVYGDKFAVVLFEKGDVMVVVIESTPVANAYRKQFELFWSESKVPDFHKQNRKKKD